MLLNRKKKIGFFYIGFLIVYVFCMAQYTFADDELNQLGEDIKKTLRSLSIPQSEESKNNQKNLIDAIQAFSGTMASDDEETKKILKNWNDYIINVSHFSNANYLNAIKKQTAEYYKAIANLNNMIGENKTKRRRSYSSSWIDDLFNHFGKAFIKTNQMAIKQSLFALSVAGSDDGFEQKLKDLIYIETMLYGSYKRYLGIFLSFYKEKLDQNAQKKLEPRKNLAVSFLALIDKVSLSSMQDTTVLQKLLAEYKARQLNDEVFKFLKNHHISDSLDFSIALEDFKKALKD